MNGGRERWRRFVVKKSDRFVVNHPGGWAVKAPGAQRASGVFDTQAKAQAAARQIVQNAGGGEVVTQGVNGKFRDSDTVAPGNDPNPPRDTK
ncbi:MAG: DUF2188 domain-containing protein [Phenylobacterium sp.]|nr:DUF2188 domain-containing protein [Phenylobacterium sp.]MBP7817700.1 DUF2188 domain-containing protein [Phenylobacterium sp.]MBP9230557.1 DUF2188 domain-containing protein [Phenylobacterium sp.]